MPKFDALQSDFSAAELSPRAQGHVDSEAYKAGLLRAANMVPTRVGSIASRAGGQWLSDGFNAAALAPDNSPVQHIPIQDGPFGDFVIEIGRFGLRLMDKFGVQDLSRYQEEPLFDLSFRGAHVWGDPDSGAVYLQNNLIQAITTGPGIGFVKNPAGFPVGTNGAWTLTGRIAGDDVNVLISQIGPPATQNFVITAAGFGTFTLPFTPVGDFLVQVSSVNSVIWDLKLQKNATKTAFSLTPLFGISPPIPGVDRIRAAAFWTSKDSPIDNPGLGFTESPATFWVAFAGGPNGQWAGWVLSWAVPPSGHGQWQLGQLPTDADSLALIQGSSVVSVYQDRLIFGNNAASGRPQIVTSSVGFLDVYDNELVAGYNFPGPANPLVRFTFKKFKYTYTVVGVAGGVATGQEANRNVNSVPAGAGVLTGVVRGIRVDFPGVPIEIINTFATHPTDVTGAPLLAVKLNGVPVKVTPVPNGFASVKLPAAPFGDTVKADPGLECWAEYPNSLGVFSPWGCTVWFNDDPSTNSGQPGPLLIGTKLEFSTVPSATDPLNLTLASPTGDIAWINVLRGLLLGTTRSEKLFPSSGNLAIDPATGAAFTVEDESNLGSDALLPALDVDDKVLFCQRGRQVIRMANISINTSGGLVSVDVGPLGEHLTKARVRGLCYLRTPVPRVVFAMDDGSGAVMTLAGKVGAAWSRFTIPAAFGGIYSVAALDGPTGSELWVGTENGVTLHWNTFESDIIPKTRTFDQAFPLPPARSSYDTENPLPPIMDGWTRAGLTADGKVFRLSASLVGQSVFVLVNGQAYGPYVAAADGLGGAGVTLPATDFTFALGTTWVDGSGATRPQEVYVGLAYPEHRIITLPLEGGNPAGTSQAYKGRWVQCTLRLVDAYRPVVGGWQAPERGVVDPTDLLAGRLTGDIRVTQLKFKQATTLEVSQPKPLRLEVSAIFGGAQINSP